ncbi:MAG TPA: DUF2225 domain-containing protein [Thermoanaerobaculia bacterium]
MRRAELPAVLVLFALFLGLATSAGAHTFTTQEFKCPIDGKRFTAMVDGSGYQEGVRLDLKPVGPTPAPWIIPVCPKCHFVVYDEELDPEVKKRLRPFIFSKEYKRLAKEHSSSSYFLLAKIFEFQGEDDEAIGDMYLQASWEVEYKKPERYHPYLRAARDAYSRSLGSVSRERENGVAVQFLIGELDRQLGEFERAEALFASLAATLESPDGETWRQLIALERKLIAAKDSAPYQRPVFVEQGSQQEAE